MSFLQGRSRGVSNVVGFALLLGLVISGATLTVALGAVAFDDLQRQATLDRTENVMTLFDTRASQVALGGSPSQSVTLGRGDGGSVDVAESAGQLQVLYRNETGSERTLVSEPLGAVRYETDESVVAYQGGGVWRRTGDYSTMVSVPEFHYRNATLTFPIVRVTGEAGSMSAASTLQVRDNGTDRVFPDAASQNPLDEGAVVVRVTSAYHEGWAEYFKSRTEGSVDHDPANETVEVTLTVPVEENFEYAVAATSNDSDAISATGNAKFEGPTVVGANRPMPDREIDSHIEDCEAGTCTNISSPLSSTLAEGTYYADGPLTVESGAEFDTAGGDVTVVVNGSLTFTGTGGPGNLDQSITGSNGTVRFYVRGDVTAGGNAAVNTGGNASDLLVMVHSDGDTVAAASGTPQFTGVIYAPGSEFEINGGGACGASKGNGKGNGNSKCNGNIVGSVVVEEATAVGNGKLTYDGSMDISVEFTAINDITYLHVTENRIDVSED
ncbi:MULTISPECIES: DUF7289 family protein [Salinibaculum]|uniref:DUF7289 family protein n=1 Tax=Salinibaculum TaxID=2732368 RepID=UPI0030D52F97